jgi:hypothetical protein
VPPPPLHHLHHLALDTRYNQSPSPSPTILASLLTHIKTSSPLLQSFTVKLPERKVVIGEAFITQLVEQFGSSLRRLAFLDCGISLESLTEVCSACINLETLEISIPTKELVSVPHTIHILIFFVKPSAYLTTATVFSEHLTLQNAAHACRCS